MKKTLIIMLALILIFGFMYGNEKRHGVISVPAGDSVVSAALAYDTLDLSPYLQVLNGDYISEVDGSALVCGENIAFGYWANSMTAVDSTNCSLFIYILPESTKYKMLLWSGGIVGDSLSGYSLDTLVSGAKRIFKFARKLEIVTKNVLTGDSAVAGHIDLIYAE